MNTLVGFATPDAVCRAANALVSRWRSWWSVSSAKASGHHHARCAPRGVPSRRPTSAAPSPPALPAIRRRRSASRYSESSTNMVAAARASMVTRLDWPAGRPCGFTLGLALMMAFGRFYGATH